MYIHETYTQMYSLKANVYISIPGTPRELSVAFPSGDINHEAV